MLRQRDHYELVLYGATLRKTDYGDTLLLPQIDFCSRRSSWPAPLRGMVRPVSS